MYSINYIVIDGYYVDDVIVVLISYVLEEVEHCDYWCYYYSIIVIELIVLKYYYYIMWLYYCDVTLSEHKWLLFLLLILFSDHCSLTHGIVDLCDLFTMFWPLVLILYCHYCYWHYPLDSLLCWLATLFPFLVDRDIGWPTLLLVREVTVCVGHCSLVRCLYSYLCQWVGITIVVVLQWALVGSYCVFWLTLYCDASIIVLCIVYWI